MQLLRIKELSQLLKVKQSTLYAWSSRGMIPSFKINGLLRFDLEEIEEWIKSSKIVPLPAKNPKPKHIRNKEIDIILNKAIESVKKQGYNSPQWRNQTNQAHKKGGRNGSL